MEEPMEMRFAQSHRGRELVEGRLRNVVFVEVTNHGGDAVEIVHACSVVQLRSRTHPILAAKKFLRALNRLRWRGVCECKDETAPTTHSGAAARGWRVQQPHRDCH